MLKFISNGTIEDGSKYTKYYSSSLNHLYIILNGKVYTQLVDDLLSIDVNLSMAHIALYANAEYVLAIPVNTTWRHAYLINDFGTSAGLFIQRSKMNYLYLSSVCAIAIKNKVYRYISGTFDSTKEYLYKLADNCLFAFEPMKTVLACKFKCELIIQQNTSLSDFTQSNIQVLNTSLSDLSPFNTLAPDLVAGKIVESATKSVELIAHHKELLTELTIIHSSIIPKVIDNINIRQIVFDCMKRIRDDLTELNKHL